MIEDDKRNAKARDLIGQQQGLAGVQVFKYIRLTELIPQLLEMLDAGSFSIRAGVDLSYLKRGSQELLFEYIKKNSVQRLDNEKASVLRKTNNDSGLTEETISEIMKKKPDSKSRSISFKRTELLKFFPSSMSNEEIIQKIYMLLESIKL
ncbi:MAG: hypothetical protein HPY74_10900 [Firmicutes bacterium]|nr:hypothetical protein [Bacillota bacterium]